MSVKTVVIVNGKGGVGKDTLCNYFCRYYNGAVTSAINPIKKYAKRLGWRETKDPEDRKFLAELKRIMDERFNTSRVYLAERFRDFMKSDKQVLFVMMREPDDIDYFKDLADADKDTRVVTLLIKRKEVDDQEKYGNFADDNVEDYRYDYIFDNDGLLEESHRDFVVMVRHMTEAPYL